MASAQRLSRARTIGILTRQPGIAALMLTLEESLWDMEQKFWLEGSDFHARNLTDDAVLLLPQPAGVLAKDAAGAWACSGFTTASSCARTTPAHTAARN